MEIENSSKGLEVFYGTKSVHEFILHFNSGSLNLEPGFQRRSVWTLSDRRKLIGSVLNGYPLPSIFLHKEDQGGRLIYSVIDGKQRLESLLMFLAKGRFKSQRFAAKVSLDMEAPEQLLTASDMGKRHVLNKILSYRIPIVEVSGDLGEIIELFVLINSTGKKLASAEKRHAKFYTSPLLKAVEKLAGAQLDSFKRHGVLSSGQVSRMKHIELFSELVTSVLYGGLIDKKKTVDIAVGDKKGTFTHTEIKGAINETRAAIKTIFTMFPDIKTTRFSNVSDFYSLFMFVWEARSDGAVLTQSKRNTQAAVLLKDLSAGVATVRDQLAKGKGATRSQQIYLNYLLAVRSDTDSKAQRTVRSKILQEILGGLFEKKDTKRLFTKDQKMILWHSTVEPKCAACKVKLKWGNFTVDHKKAYVLGGKTVLKNADLMCDTCNKKKGKGPLLKSA